MYETYRVTKTMDQYFEHWKKEDLDKLTSEQKKDIYQKYFVKAAVFQRDDFQCQNEDCKTPESYLTLHHTKFLKNNGKWSLKNCVTICKTCHANYHRGKATLTYDGMTYKLNKTEEINWKKVRVENKEVRKKYKEVHGVRISWELMAQLMKFLFDKEIDWETLDDDY